MTKQQERKVNMIREQAENLHGKHSSEYEIKEWKVEENEFFVSVVVEVGMIGDEGTMASIICRDRLQVFIGKRGGAKIPFNTDKKSYYKPFKFMTFGNNNWVNA